MKKDMKKTTTKRASSTQSLTQTSKKGAIELTEEELKRVSGGLNMKWDLKI